MEFVLIFVGLVILFGVFTFRDQRHNYKNFNDDNRRINTQTSNLVVK